MRVTGQPGTAPPGPCFPPLRCEVVRVAGEPGGRLGHQPGTLHQVILRAGDPGGQAAGQVRKLSRAEASAVIRHPARLLASARAIRRLITASASFRWSRHMRSLDSARSAGNLNRRPAQAGQPGRGTAVMVSSTSDRSKSTGPNACWTKSVIAPRPISSHSGETAVITAPPGAGPGCRTAGQPPCPGATSPAYRPETTASVMRGGGRHRAAAEFGEHGRHRGLLAVSPCRPATTPARRRRSRAAMRWRSRSRPGAVPAIRADPRSPRTAAARRPPRPAQAARPATDSQLQQLRAHPAAGRPAEPGPRWEGQTATPDRSLAPRGAIGDGTHRRRDRPLIKHRHGRILTQNR